MQDMNPDIFHTNVHLWSRINPKAAMRLQYLMNPSVRFMESESGKLNLVKEVNGAERLYHDSIDPVIEASRWFSSLDLQGSSVLYVYGIGLGYYYDAALEWLHADPLRNLIFLEDDIEILQCLLQTERGTRILSDNQALIFYFEDLKDEEKLFDELYWDFILTQMAISCLKVYGAERKERFVGLKHKIVHDAAIKNALVEEYLKFGIPFFRNFYPNMLLLAESWQGTKLYGKFQNIPAVICGAGPSLERNIGILKEYLDRALIFGGGSALNALSSRDILPHFGIGIDPNPTQQYRLSTNKAYEVPLFYRNRMHKEAFRLIHGPRLYIPGAGGYEVADWFDNRFGLNDETESLDEGHNVVNFGLELAKYLGCNPIIFVGVDLAYTEMQSYASGIIDDTSVDKSDILNTGDFDTTAMIKEDIYGKPIYTLWKWIAESEWTGEYAKANPELTIINSTEGGLGMPGIPNIPLQEVADKYFIRDYDLRSRVDGEILQSAFDHVSEESVKTTMKELSDSLHRSVEHIDVLIREKTDYRNKLVNEASLPSSLQSGPAALAEIELEEEPAYEHIIGVFNLVYSRILNKDLRYLNQGTTEADERERELLKTRINLKRFTFMREVANVNIKLIAEAEEMRLQETESL